MRDLRALRKELAELKARADSRGGGQPPPLPDDFNDWTPLDQLTWFQKHRVGTNFFTTKATMLAFTLDTAIPIHIADGYAAWMDRVRQRIAEGFPGAWDYSQLMAKRLEKSDNLPWTMAAASGLLHNRTEPWTEQQAIRIFLWAMRCAGHLTTITTKTLPRPNDEHRIAATP